MNQLDQIEELRALASAHNAAEAVILQALEEAGGVIAGEGASPFQQRVEYLRRRLGSNLPAAAVEENARDVGQELERFAHECAHERARKAWECKQIIQTLAETAAVLAQNGASENLELADLATRIDAISRLETVAEVRQQLAIRVGEIKSLAGQAGQNGRRLASLLEAKVRRAEERLQAAQRLAETDPLTEIGNRRMAENAVEAAIAADTPLNLILCDLDDFKAINDGYGHRQGDQLLKAVAQAVRGAVRSSDVVCRWGGDEFVILLIPALPSATADEIAAAIQRDAFGEFVLKHGEREVWVPVTASVGTTTYQPGESVFNFFERADQLMYEKKVLRRAARAAAVPTVMAAG